VAADPARPDLTYREIGLVLAIPGFVGSALESLIGLVGNTPQVFFHEQHVIDLEEGLPDGFLRVGVE
jgi:hypothetical protein